MKVLDLIAKYGAAAQSMLIPLGDRALMNGNVWFVNSAATGAQDANNGVHGHSWETPLATLDYAITLCTASLGDVILLAPTHAETVASAGDITIDKIGVTIIGLGSGSFRPTFTWSTTASTFLITAANVSISNIITQVSVDSVVVMFTVSAARASFDRVDFVETSAKQALIFLNTTADGDDLTIKNCKHDQVAAGSAKWIDLVGADRAAIVNNTFNVQASTHIVGGTTTESLMVNIHDNKFINPADAAAIVLLASSTGLVTGNIAAGAKSAIAGMFALAGAYGAENYALNTANKSGILDPVADS